MNKEYAFGNRGNTEIYTLEDGDLIRYMKRPSGINRYNFSKGDGSMDENVGEFLDLLLF